MQTVRGKVMMKASAKRSTKLLDPPKTAGFCFYCYKYVKKEIPQCPKCKTAKYCSRECQNSDWKRHKLCCGDTEKDIDQMRILAFMPLEKFAVINLESLTKSGTLPCFIEIRSDRLAMGIESKVITEEKVIKYFYRQGFQPGNYHIRFIRGTLISFLTAIRLTAGPGDTPVGNVPAGGFKWVVNYGTSKPSDRHLNSIRFSHNIHRNNPTLEAFLKGELNIDAPVSEIASNVDIEEFRKKAESGNLSTEDVGKMAEKISTALPAAVEALGKKVDPEMKEMAHQFQQNLKEKGINQVVDETLGDLKKSGIDIEKILEENLSDSGSEAEENDG